jgi:hypothetical protein
LKFGESRWNLTKIFAEALRALFLHFVPIETPLFKLYSHIYPFIILTEENQTPDGTLNIG